MAGRESNDGAGRVAGFGDSVRGQGLYTNHLIGPLCSVLVGDSSVRVPLGWHTYYDSAGRKSWKTGGSRGREKASKAKHGTATHRGGGGGPGWAKRQGAHREQQRLPGTKTVGNAVEGHSPPRAQPSPDSSPSGFRLAPSPVAAVRLEPMGLPPVVEAASETESHGRWVPPGPEQGARMRVAVNDMGGRNVFFGSFCTARAPVAMAPAARRMSPFPRLTEAGRQLTKRDGCHWGPVQPRKGVAQAPETARRRPVRRSAPPVSNPGYLGRPARRRDTHGYSYLAALHRDCGRLPSDRGDARTRSTRRGVRSDTELVCVGTPGCAVPRDKEVPRC